MRGWRGGIQTEGADDLLGGPSPLFKCLYLNHLLHPGCWGAATALQRNSNPSAGAMKGYDLSTIGEYEKCMEDQKEGKCNREKANRYVNLDDGSLSGGGKQGVLCLACSCSLSPFSAKDVPLLR